MAGKRHPKGRKAGKKGKKGKALESYAQLTPKLAKGVKRRVRNKELTPKQLKRLDKIRVLRDAGLLTAAQAGGAVEK